MNNFKKIGLTALAASLVSVSAHAGAISVSGGASINVEGFSGEELDNGSGYTMGNQLTFSGSGELDNGLTVSVSFVLDQGDDNGTNGTSADSNGNAPFDSHSVKVSSDSLGTLTFNGEGGTTAANNIDGTAAGDIWDKFDGLANATAQKNADGVTATATAGNNSFIYSSPELMEGLTATVSYQPQGASGKSGTGYGLNYTGVEGLTLKYAVADKPSYLTTANGDVTVMYASYAYGPVTVSYSDMESDIEAAGDDYEIKSMAVSYTVSDELSITYGTEDAKQETVATEAEFSTISMSYTSGGMTISAGMHDAENADFTTDSHADYEKWTLGASFAF